jgi:phenylacetate-CoA ligase
MRFLRQVNDRFVRQFKNRFVRWQYARMAHSLSTVDPEKIIVIGEHKLLRAFHRAAEKVPAYRKLLSERGVDPRKITTVEEFKEKVPFIDKEIVFPVNELRDICVGGNLDDICSFYSSSGHSGVFSFGAETWDNTSSSALGLEFLLDNHFQISRRKTLLINCLPMGVKIYTRTLPVADTSVRADVVHALIKKLASEFDQFILVGESPFLKKVIEEGAEKGILWRYIIINVITGGEFIAESFRSYLGHLLGIDFEDPESGIIAVNMGLSELSLSIFSENFQTIQLRRMAHKDHNFRQALFGDGAKLCPLIMQYFPQQTFLETVPSQQGIPELVVSTISENVKIPLIRYKTGDMVRTLSYTEMKNILKDLGQESLLPEFHLPFGIIWGKKLSIDLGNGERISPNEVKEALYQNFDIAGRITGNFRLSKNNGVATVLVQLRNGFEILPDMAETLSDYLKNYIKAETKITFLPYNRFPYGMEHDYEKKNQYI